MPPISIVLNNIEELYNLVVRIAPKAVNKMSRIDFMMHYSAKVQHTPWGNKYFGVKNEGELKKMLESCMLRRTKIDGLPSRVDKTITLDVKGADLKKLIKEENEFLIKAGIDPNEIKKDLKLSSMDMSALAAVRQRTAIFKIKFFMDVLPDIREKARNLIIYVYHRDVQVKVSEQLMEKGIKHKIINGSVSNKKRAAIISEFQSGMCNVILATISSLKEGVNLTKGEAVLFIEHDWTPANIEQAIGRVHRRGQENTVLIYHFLFNDGIDKYIKNTLKRKSDLIKKVIS